MWLAEKYRAIGLKPAGDDGTYFQYFTLWRNHIADNSSILINNTPLTLWKDVAVAQMANITLDEPVIYLGNALNIDTTINVKGKVVAIEANAKGILPILISDAGFKNGLIKKRFKTMFGEVQIFSAEKNINR